MRVAHLMLAHDRPDLAIRLAGVLDGPVFVHVDSKVDPAPFEPAGQLVTPRVHPSWGSFGIVEATVAGMRSALREPFDRLMLLSGRDYPIKPASVIHDEMEAQGSVIECAKFPHPDWADGGWPRVRRWNRRSGPSRKGLGMAALEARAQIETLVRGQREGRGPRQGRGQRKEGRPLQRRLLQAGRGQHGLGERGPGPATGGPVIHANIHANTGWSGRCRIFKPIQP